MCLDIEETQVVSLDFNGGLLLAGLICGVYHSGECGALLLEFLDLLHDLGDHGQTRKDEVLATIA